MSLDSTSTTSPGASVAEVSNAHRNKRVHGFEADVYWREPDGYVALLWPGDGLYMMSSIHPTGSHAAHATRARNRVMTYDARRPR